MKKTMIIGLFLLWLLPLNATNEVMPISQFYSTSAYNKKEVVVANGNFTGKNIVVQPMRETSAYDVRTWTGVISPAGALYPKRIKAKSGNLPQEAFASTIRRGPGLIREVVVRVWTLSISPSATACSSCCFWHGGRAYW